MNRFVLGTLIGLVAALVVLRLSRRRGVPGEPIEQDSAEEQASP